DVNADGYADVIISAPRAGGSGWPGRAHLYLGGPAGLAATPTTSIDPPAGEGGFFGHSVASAGDVNGDGYADAVIGASLANRAYVYHGGPSGLATAPATSLTGPSGAEFGWSVASAGDVTGDGYADVIVGAPDD